jgi:hypothetical protein
MNVRVRPDPEQRLHFRFVVTRTDRTVIRLIKRAGVEEILANNRSPPGALSKVEAHEQDYNFIRRLSRINGG